MLFARYDNLDNVSWLIRKASEILNYNEQKKLNDIFIAYPELEVPHVLKERFRRIYNLSDKRDVIDKYNDWEDSIPREFTPFKSVCRTIDNWHTEIFNYFDYPYTNALTEGSNNVIRAIERAGRGYSFEHLRGRVLYGTPATKKKHVDIDELLNYL